MKKTFYFSCFFSIIFLLSCSKSSESPQKNCKILSETTEGGGQTDKTEFVYNTLGQVERVNVFLNNKLVNFYTYVYSGNNISQLSAFYDPNSQKASNTATFVYNADNTVKEMNTFFETLTGKQPCKLLYQYNDGHLTQVSLAPVKSAVDPSRYILKGYNDKLKYDAMQNVTEVQREEVTDKVNNSYIAATYQYVIEEDYTVKLASVGDAATLFELFEESEIADYSEFSDNSPTNIKLNYPFQAGKMLVEAKVIYGYNSDKLPISADITIDTDYQINGKSSQKATSKKRGTYVYECK